MIGVSEFPGGQFILNGRLNALLERGGTWWDAPDPERLASYLTSYVCIAGKVRFLQSPPLLAVKLAEGRAVLAEMIGSMVMDRIDELLEKETPKLSSTRSCRRVAKKLIALLNEERERHKEEGKKKGQSPQSLQSPQSSQSEENSPSQGGNDEREGDEGEGGEGGEGNEGTRGSAKSAGSESLENLKKTQKTQKTRKSQESSGEEGRGEGEGEGDEGDKGDEGTSDSKDSKGSKGSKDSNDSYDSDDSSGPARSSRSSRSSQPSPDQIAKRLRRMLSGFDETVNCCENSLGGFKPIHDPTYNDVNGSLWEEWTAGGKFVELTPASHEFGTARIHGAAPLAERLRSILNGMLQAETHSGAYLSSTGRRVSPTAIGRLAVGNLRVMEKRASPKKGFDTCVNIVLDSSGSMDTSFLKANGDRITRLDIASRAAYGLLLALRKIRNCSSALTVFPGNAHTRSYLPAEIVPPGRNSLTKEEISRIGMIAAYGGTDVAGALRTVLSSMELRTESRKVVIVITDGEFDTKADEYRERAERSGIDIYVLCLKDNHSGADLEAVERLATGYVVLEERDLNLDGDAIQAKTVSAIARFSKMGMFRVK